MVLPSPTAYFTICPEKTKITKAKRQRWQTPYQISKSMDNHPVIKYQSVIKDQ